MSNVLTLEDQIKKAKVLSNRMWTAMTTGDERGMVEAARELGQLLDEVPEACKALTVEDREAVAFQLRIAGKSTSQVATALGYESASGATKAIERYRQKHIVPPLEVINELVEVEHIRHETLVEALWAKATTGDLDAIRTYIALSRSIRDLLGMDAPKKALLGHRDLGGEPTVLILPEKDIIEVEAKEVEDE